VKSELDAPNSNKILHPKGATRRTAKGIVGQSFVMREIVFVKHENKLNNIKRMVQVFFKKIAFCNKLSF